MEMIPIVGIISSSAMVILVVYFVTRARQRRVEAHIEMQSKLIDRFGSAPELITFLQSPAGKEFVAGVQKSPAVATRERILSGFTRAIILTMLGLAFMFLTYVEGDDDFVIPATILFALGVGYFLATFVTYKLSAKFHLGEIEQPATTGGALS
jgi:hypothetical protein